MRERFDTSTCSPPRPGICKGSSTTRAVRFDADGTCLRGNVRARWANAELSADTQDCAMQQATLSFDDGTMVNTAIGQARMLGVVLGEISTVVYVATVMEDSAAQRRGVRAGERIYAVNAQKVPETGDVSQQAARMIADSQGPVTLTLTDFEGQSPRDVTMVPGPTASSRLRLIPDTPTDVIYPDGSRYSGAINLGPAGEDGKLPLPQPKGIGQRLTATGGYLGTFANGLPHGQGYCFDADRGGPCRHQRGQRVYDTGAPERSRQQILAETQGLSGQAATDLLRKRMVDALLAERWQEYLRRLTDLQTLGVDTGVEAIYYEANALASLGRTEPAFERVNAYLNLAGASGASYADALSLYSELEPEAQAARAAREREQAAAREQRRRFCEARNQADAPLCGCREFDVRWAQGAQCEI